MKDIKIPLDMTQCTPFKKSKYHEYFSKLKIIEEEAILCLRLFNIGACHHFINHDCDIVMFQTDKWNYSKLSINHTYLFSININVIPSITTTPHGYRGKGEYDVILIPDTPILIKDLGIKNDTNI